MHPIVILAWLYDVEIAGVTSQQNVLPALNAPVLQPDEKPSSRDGGRSNPSRMASRLLRLSKPVEYNPCERMALRHNMPPADSDGIRRLLDALGAVSWRSAIFPSELEADIGRHCDCPFVGPFMWGRPAPAAWIDSAKADDAGGGQPGANEAGSEKGATSATAMMRLLANELDEALCILGFSLDCQRENRAEAAWNAYVHLRVLQLALKRNTTVRECHVTAARVAPAFQPRDQALLAQRSSSSASVSSDASQADTPSAAGDSVGKAAKGSGATVHKMVDFALVLSLADNPFAAKVRDVVNTQCLGRDSINQSTYDELRYRPIGVSIETKTSTGSLEEGRLQLGAWTAAWHRRVLDLLGLDAAGSGNVGDFRVITLPLIMVQDDKWEVWFAIDRGNKIVCTPLFYLSRVFAHLRTSLSCHRGKMVNGSHC